VTGSRPAVAYIEFLVGDPAPWEAVLTALGFRANGHLYLSDRRTTVFRAGSACINLSVPRAGSAPATRLAVHGPGISGIALHADDLDALYYAAIAAGAEPTRPPRWRIELGEDHEFIQTGAAVVDFGAVQCILLASRVRHLQPGEAA
jgi:4-hydroxyphenylpyruvate dioxygenase-like putative hemolysin